MRRQNTRVVAANDVEILIVVWVPLFAPALGIACATTAEDAIAAQSGFPATRLIERSPTGHDGCQQLREIMRLQARRHHMGPEHCLDRVSRIDCEALQPRWSLPLKLNGVDHVPRNGHDEQGKKRCADTDSDDCEPSAAVPVAPSAGERDEPKHEGKRRGQQRGQSAEKRPRYGAANCRR